MIPGLEPFLLFKLPHKKSIIALMSIHKIILKWIALLVLAAILVFCLHAFSPYQEDESLNSTVILIVFGMVATLSFFVFQAIFSLFFKHQSANQLAFVGSLALIQIILINSWNFINLSSMLVILMFNLFVCWYALKVL